MRKIGRVHGTLSYTLRSVLISSTHLYIDLPSDLFSSTVAIRATCQSHPPSLCGSNNTRRRVQITLFCNSILFAICLSTFSKLCKAYAVSYKRMLSSAVLFWLVQVLLRLMEMRQVTKFLVLFIPFLSKYVP